MSKRSKVSRNYVPVFAGLWLLLFFITFQLGAKNKGAVYHLTDNSDTTVPVTHKKNIKDTGTFIKKDTLLRKDTLPKPTTLVNAPDSFFVADSLKGADTAVKQHIDTMLISKDSLTSPIEYSADDSGVLIIPTRQFFLYGKAHTKNEDVDLTANNIQYNQATQVIKAFGGIDTANNPLSKPTIVQGDQTTISDTIEFNIHSQRALAKNSYYNEGDLFVNAQKVKKISKDAAYAYMARFTTCNLDTPHFDIRAKRMKIINNKIAVSGPAYPEFEGVPIPIIIPFGIYPLSQGRHSGLLPIEFTTNESYGLGIEGLGYYKVINDNWDVTARGNIYTYGGWTITINPKYYKRYKYQGNLSMELQNSRILNNSSSGFTKDEFNKTRTFNILWSHSQDTKAHPGTTFSASVNAGSTKFNENVPNNALRNYNNMLQSSISYSKSSPDGKYNLTVSATHNQNNNLRLQNISLPNIGFTVNTIYPFQRKEAIGTPKWYEKLGIAYNGNIRNQFSFYDTAFNFKHILDTARFGAEHNIPITLSLPALGPFIVSPNISFSQLWFGEKNNISWDEARKRVDTITQRGFYTASRMSYGFGINTRIFGTLNFPKSKHIVAIRHEIKPTIGFSYTPDLVSQYYKIIQVDTLKNFRSVPMLGNSVYSLYGQGRAGTISIGLDNLLEMKVKNNQDSTGDEPTRKVKLIDGLSINTGYNILADSLNWSPISINFRTTLLKKVNVTGNATINPYGVDQSGYVVNDLLWTQGRIGRLTNAGLNISTSLQSKSKDGKTQQERVQGDETLTVDEQTQELQYMRDNPAEFTDFDIPWTLQLSFATSFSKIPQSNYTVLNEFTSSININGDFSLTPKWKLGGNIIFNVKEGKIGVLTMYASRDMHCWQLSINVTPIGYTRSFSIVLNPKSGLLRDLRINRSRYFNSY